MPIWLALKRRKLRDGEVVEARRLKISESRLENPMPWGLAASWRPVGEEPGHVVGECLPLNKDG
jgi:hypothetical protein